MRGGYLNPVQICFPQSNLSEKKKRWKNMRKIKQDVNPLHTSYGEHHWLIEEQSRFCFQWNAREYRFMTSTSERSQTFCVEYLFELIDKMTWSVTFSGTDGNLSATRGWAFCWRKEIICKRNVASVNWTKIASKVTN